MCRRRVHVPYGLEDLGRCSESTQEPRSIFVGRFGLHDGRTLLRNGSEPPDIAIHQG